MRGAPAQRERPDWEPLIALVGLDVVGCFMWMNELELEDGSRCTRTSTSRRGATCTSAVDGRVFAERAGDRYEEVTPLAALEEAFMDWEDLYPPSERSRTRCARCSPARRSGSSQETH